MSTENRTVVDKYVNLDLGSGKMISIPMETVYVTINTKDLLGDFVRGFIRELTVRNPWRSEQITLTEGELLKYIEYLLTCRVKYVNGESVPWQQLKALWIPSFIQFILTMIGEVEDRDYGFRLMPAMNANSKLKFEDALATSQKLSTLADDFDMVKDAMPRSHEGNINVMSSAVIGEYVRSYRKTEHPVYTYVAAMLNLKLKEEAALSALYRFQYDDVNFIHTALSVTRSLF